MNRLIIIIIFLTYSDIFGSTNINNNNNEDFIVKRILTNQNKLRYNVNRIINERCYHLSPLQLTSLFDELDKKDDSFIICNQVSDKELLNLNFEEKEENNELIITHDQNLTTISNKEIDMDTDIVDLI